MDTKTILFLKSNFCTTNNKKKCYKCHKFWRHVWCRYYLIRHITYNMTHFENTSCSLFMISTKRISEQKNSICPVFKLRILRAVLSCTNAILDNHFTKFSFQESFNNPQNDSIISQCLYIWHRHVNSYELISCFCEH